MLFNYFILLHPLRKQWYYGFPIGELAPPTAFLDEPTPNAIILDGNMAYDSLPEMNFTRHLVTQRLKCVIGTVRHF